MNEKCTKMNKWRDENGDCREWSGKADAVVSDPPYGMKLNTDISG